MFLRCVSELVIESREVCRFPRLPPPRPVTVSVHPSPAGHRRVPAVQSGWLSPRGAAESSLVSDDSLVPS